MYGIQFYAFFYQSVLVISYDNNLMFQSLNYSLIIMFRRKIINLFNTVILAFYKSDNLLKKFSYGFKSIINVDNHLDLVRAISLALWNATLSCIINAGISPENRVNKAMKCIFLKLKYRISLISYIHYLHLEFYYMHTIACNKVVACDSFVCSLKELTSLKDV